MATPGISRQVRFRVPASDEVVLDWLEAQDNVSFSLRNMIRSFALTYGMQDATCLPLADSPQVMPAPPVVRQGQGQGSSTPAQIPRQQAARVSAKPTQNHSEQVSQSTPAELTLTPASAVQSPAPVQAPTPESAPASDEATRIADINSLLDD